MSISSAPAAIASAVSAIFTSGKLCDAGKQAADAGYLHAFGSEDLTDGLDEVRIDTDSCDGGDILRALEVIDRGDELSDLLLGIGTRASSGRSSSGGTS